MSEFLSLLFTWENLGEILTIVFGSLLLVVTAKYKRLFGEIFELAEKYIAAKNEKSPGGKKITKTEKAAILDEFLDVLKETLNMFSGGIFGKIMGLGRMFKRKK